MAKKADHWVRLTFSPIEVYSSFRRRKRERLVNWCGDTGNSKIRQADQKINGEKGSFADKQFTTKKKRNNISERVIL